MIKKKLGKEIKRINQLRANARYYWFKHPDKYKKNYTKNNKRGLILKNCKCSCGERTNGIWKTGHNLRLNPRPENLGKYLGKGYEGFSKKGKKHPHWKGGKIIVDGYRYIHKPKHPNSTKDGYVCEHRLVMENKLKRYLTKKEVVHHKDENKLNNKEYNLFLAKNQGEHNKFHIKDRNELGRFISGGGSV